MLIIGPDLISITKQNQLYLSPRASRGLNLYNSGNEVKRRDFSRPQDFSFEVIDPKSSLARSLVTREEAQFSGSYFVSVEEAEPLHDAQDLALPSEVYHHAFTGFDYQVAQTQSDADTISMIYLETGDQSLFPHLANAQFYKVD